MKFPFLKNEDIDREAERLRLEALGSRAQQVPVDLDAIVYDYLYEQEGLIICDDADLADEDGEEVLGKLEIGPGKIHINARLKKERGRYRFTLAHELGHWRLHRPLLLAEAEQPSLLAQTADKPHQMTTLNRSITGLRAPSHEIQANRFAAALLVNPRSLRREIDLRFGSTGLTPILSQHKASPLREQGRVVASRVVPGHISLAAAFDVSIEAMAIALETRGHLTPSPPSLF